MPGTEPDALNAGLEPNRARRYLLGEASDEESAALERDYFADARAVEQMEAVEEALIEEYLAGRLGPGERTSFEKRYLAAPHRRRRVETIRGLMAAAQRSTSAHASRRLRVMGWAPLAAAALFVLVLGGWWVLRTPPGAPASRDRGTNASAVSEPASTSPAPRIIAFAISPISVRSPGDTSTLVVPPGIGVVRLHLEGAPGDDARIDAARARVRTVAGADVWRGPAAAPTDAPAGTIAQIDVPAARLEADDYVIELVATDAAGAERERFRYFLAVRAR